MHQAAIFDMDGTLLSLDVDIERARRRLTAMFSPLGYRGPFSPILARIDEAAAAVASSEPQRRQLVRQARAILDAEEVAAAATSQPRAGAAVLLAALTSRGVALGLVTDNGRACVKLALAAAGLGDLPWQASAVLTRDDVARGKPDPEGLLAAAAHLAPPATRLWWLGDTPRDVAAGHAARARRADLSLHVVALTGGRATPADLRAAKPDHLVTEHAELLPLVISQRRKTLPPEGGG